MAVSNTFTTAGSDPNIGGVFPQEYADSLQRRLNDNANWKETLNWVLSPTQLANFPYMSTEFSAQSGTRGTAFSWSAYTITNDQVRINNQDVVPVFISHADAIQMGSLASWIELGERMGKVVSDRIGALTLAKHASWTDFGTASIGAGGAATSPITVSAVNIDDIIRGVEREVEEASGFELANENGYFIEWQPAQKEFLSQFAQANGFQLADKALRDGLKNDYFLMGFHHYVSNRHTANHLFGGVRKIFQLGLLRGTWGQMYSSNEIVPESGGPVLGNGKALEIDYGFNAPTAHTALIFDINVVS